MDTYVKWTDEEWAALAKRAAALKAAKPDMSWTQIVPICQDDIAPERRRFSINKLSGLKPMFDILDLDDQGNAKPPPPPPPPPEPELPVPVVATPPFANPAQSLSDAPLDALVTEILNRGTSLQKLAVELTGMKGEISAQVAASTEKVETVLKRIDTVEDMVLKADEKFTNAMGYVTAIKDQYEELRAICKDIQKAFDSCAPDVLKKVMGQAANETIDRMLTKPVNGNGAHVPERPMVRFLLIGPLQKDMARIRERLPRTLNVDLLYGENSEQIRLPNNIHYCLISGHADFTRRWQTCRDTYGQSRVHRLENGSIGTFAHQIETLALLHEKHGKY